MEAIRTRLFLAFATLSWLTTALGNAQAPPPTPGQLVPGLATAEGERYSVYLPSSWNLSAKWPTLIAMDPRGRAERTAEIFRVAAERFGYVVLSSESSRSDLPPGTPDPNEPALLALFEEAEVKYGADPTRFYLAGFSGTSKFAWSAGQAFPQRVAGVIGCGGGLPGPWERWNQVAFSYFGTAGHHDFNHREMRDLDALLDGVIPHRFRYFEGGHQWFESADAERALAWFELEAQREGRIPKHQALVDELFAPAVAAVDEFERTGDRAATFEALLAIAEDFLDLVPEETLEPLRERAGALSEDAEVRRASSLLADVLERERAFRETLGLAVRKIAYEPSPPAAKQLARDLQLDELRDAAQGEPPGSHSARRRQELAFVQLAAYVPTSLLAKKAPRRAALSLEVATRIFPERIYPWVRLGEAQARSGARKAALEALAKAVSLGYTNAEHLRTDPAFVSLIGDEAFDRLVRRIEGAGSDGPPGRY